MSRLTSSHMLSVLHVKHFTSPTNPIRNEINNAYNFSAFDLDANNRSHILSICPYQLVRWQQANNIVSPNAIHFRCHCRQRRFSYLRVSSFFRELQRRMDTRKKCCRAFVWNTDRLWSSLFFCHTLFPTPFLVYCAGAPSVVVPTKSATYCCPSGRAHLHLAQYHHHRI